VRRYSLPPPLILGEVTMAIQLNVNGRSHTLDVPAEMPLLWLLRN